MTRKQAHQRKNLRLSFYARSEATRWYNDYTIEQMTWLWDNNHIQWSKPMLNLGESDKKRYIEFTKKGRKWHNWYSCSLWVYIKYYAIQVGWWRYKWQRLRIAMGHHYDWQDYLGMNIDNI